jgi:5S rRNA maturation endonuclease (ribonuclease M5)
MTAREILSLLKEVRISGKGWTALCPGHDDKSRSLSVGERDRKILLHCFAGCETSLIVAALNLKMTDLFLDDMSPLKTEKKIIALYDYTDENGIFLYQVVRYSPKDFRPRRKDLDGKWIYNLEGVRRVLYQLPEVLKAGQVIVVEGEKDVHTLVDFGFTATTSQGGANGWRPEYADSLDGKDIIAIPDTNAPGQKYAETVSRSLLGKAKSIKVVKLPSGKDISDWLELKRREGKTDDQIKAELMALIKKSSFGEPEKTKPKNSLHFDKLGDLLNLPEEAIQWLVEDRLPSGGLSIMVAKPKVGKSTLARCLAVCVSQGKPWLNQDVSQGPVLYLALEEKRSELIKHFRAMGATETDPIFIFAGMSPQDGIIQLTEAVKFHKPALIIIDPLFRFTRVRDGNAYSEVTAALEPLLNLARQSGSHVLLVHHSGKGDRNGGDSILGSTAIFGSVDTAFIMKRSETTRSAYSIQRYGLDLEETVLTMDEETGWVTAGASKRDHDIQKIQGSILQFLDGTSEAVEEKELHEKVEGRKTVKQKALRKLVEEGKISRGGTGKKGNPYLYFKMLAPLTPHIYGEPANQNHKNSLPSSQSYANAGSGIFQAPEGKTNSREQETSPQEPEISVLDFEENS